MGFAIDNYAVFDCLASGGVSGNDPSSQLALEVAQAVEDFSVVAMVLHDPVQHADFHRYLGEVFERIDQTTGEDLLVFALTRPANEWATRARSRRGYHDRLQRALSSVRDSSPIDLLTITTLATRLSIPTSELPVIILTENLGSSGFAWVRTAPDDPELGDGLCHQLEQLGEIARDLAFERGDHTIESIRMAIDISGFGQVDLGTSLAEAACQALAPACRRGDRARIAELMGALRNARSRLRASIERYGGDVPPELERALTDIEVSIANTLRTQSGMAPTRFRVPEGLEPHSRALLQLASDLLKFIAAGGAQDADMSAMVMCLGKALETELNISVVQWARALAGVEMPQWFCKELPRHRERPVIDTGLGYRIDLSARGRNREKSIHNLPATLGQCGPLLQWCKQRAAEVEGRAEEAPALAPGGNVTTGMVEWIEEMRRDRNQAAHLEPIDVPSGQRAFERATDAGALELWNALVCMKRALRGDG